ncbi:mucin-16-like [Leucoraja erinacea]|uniref:mucin-16-like n=1 Tax=Leucoraja erinaceus TaxID=7782 RepID=UPI0024559416|nr:mucin-16-like [Leucoraja erinacea]
MFSRTFYTKALLWNILICWLHLSASGSSKNNETSAESTSTSKDMRIQPRIIEVESISTTVTKLNAQESQKDKDQGAAPACNRLHQMPPISPTTTPDKITIVVENVHGTGNDSSINKTITQTQTSTPSTGPVPIIILLPTKTPTPSMAPVPIVILIPTKTTTPSTKSTPSTPYIPSIITIPNKIPTRSTTTSTSSTTTPSTPHIPYIITIPNKIPPPSTTSTSAALIPSIITIPFKTLVETTSPKTVVPEHMQEAPSCNIPVPPLQFPPESTTATTAETTSTTSPKVIVIENGQNQRVGPTSASKTSTPSTTTVDISTAPTPTPIAIITAAKTISPHTPKIIVIDNVENQSESPSNNRAITQASTSTPTPTTTTAKTIAALNPIIIVIEIIQNEEIVPACNIRQQQMSTTTPTTTAAETTSTMFLTVVAEPPIVPEENKPNNQENPDSFPVEKINAIDYNVAFVVESLSIVEIQAMPLQTATMISTELTDLFKKCSFNATFLKCVVKAFREVTVNSTRVAADCSFQNVSNMEPIKPEEIYDAFRRETNNLSTLGSYALLSYSLLVDDFTLQPNVNVPVPIEITNPIAFNVMFTVDSLSFEEAEMNPSGTATTIEAELSKLFEDSSIEATFLNCAVKSFRREMVHSTRVAADCSFQNVSTIESINREDVSNVFSEKTDDILSLGPYTIQISSLFVEDVNAQPNDNVLAPIDETSPIEYNVTFIVDNLSIEEIQANPSETATMIANKLTDLFENSSVNATFLQCDVKSFRQEIVNKTRVTAKCLFQNVSTMEPIKREKIYAVLNEKIDDISSLGPYVLQSYSLYVNDFNVQHNVNVPVPIEVINPIKYNVNFIVDNLSIEEIQAKPLETTTMIANELTDLFENSSVNATFLKCDVKSFR